MRAVRVVRGARLSVANQACCHFLTYRAPSIASALGLGAAILL